MSEEKILIFSGTTEGRELSEYLSSYGIPHFVSVATDYGSEVMQPSDFAKVLVGRMTAEDMSAFIRSEQISMVIDATHPYAEVVSKEITAAAGECRVEKLRLRRKTDDEISLAGIRILRFPDTASCAESLCGETGNILLTTGSKELAAFAGREELRSRLFARVLPGAESIRLCENAGLKGRQILAMQGPFSEEMNLAILHQYDISVLVSKETGKTGGFPEKVSAAGKADVILALIGAPGENGGLGGEEVRKYLSKKLGLSEETKSRAASGRELRAAEESDSHDFEISLVGCGLGYRKSLTTEALEKVEEADLVFGASRLAAIFPEKKTLSLYRFEDIIPVIREQNIRKAAVLFSGDTGFFSGCPAFYEKARAYAEENKLSLNLSVYPGVSSVSALASRLGKGYDDAPFFSLHGRNHDYASLKKLLKIVRENDETYLILSGGDDAAMLSRLLTEEGLGSCRIRLGCQLGQEDERILESDAEHFPAVENKKLYIACVENENPDRSLTLPGWPEDAFIRTKVPMTKAEVRALSLASLGLSVDSVLYDIGSGSGSVSCEAAALSPEITVYAIEKKPDAVELTQQNRDRFGLENIQVKAGEALDILPQLPPATHAFIGGSGGDLKAILKILQEKNPSMRVVVNAVTLETMGEIAEVLRELSVKDTEIRQVQIARGRKAGPYHLMQSENPVLIAAFSFTEGR